MAGTFYFVYQCLSVHINEESKWMRANKFLLVGIRKIIQPHKNFVLNIPPDYGDNSLIQVRLEIAIFYLSDRILTTCTLMWQEKYPASKEIPL